MEVRFEDHPQFQRAAALAALGGGAAAALLGAAQAAALPQRGLAQAAVVGGALLLLRGPHLRRQRVAVALLSCAAAAGSLLASAPSLLLPSSGALLAVLFALLRRDAAQASGNPGPSFLAVGIAAALGAGAVALAALALSPLATALAVLLPGWLATGASGAAFGLWAGLAAAPLHVALGADAVEARLLALRPSLTPEVRGLAERAAQARRSAAAELPAGARGDLRGLLESLALAALDVAGRTASLSRSAAPALEEEIKTRFAELTRSAASAEDTSARSSYRRAAEALEGQLEHFGRVRRARERALARLHEDVAHLERARFSLTLLRGADQVRGAAELDLLQERLQHGALGFEAEEELAGEALAGEALATPSPRARVE